MPKPDFLLVGGHKCGTTALFSLLATSSRVQTPPVKEPHFFAYPEVLNTVRSPVSSQQEYEDLFAGVPAGCRTGEASVLYLFLHRTAIPRMREFFGSAELPLIVIMLRDPAERAYSAYCYAHQGNPDETLAFEDALAQEPRRSSDPANRLTMQYRAMGCYADQVQAYLDAFPRVRVILFEDFVADPVSCARQVLGDLGVEADIDPELIDKNEGGRRWRSQLLRRMANNPVSVRGRRLLEAASPQLHASLRKGVSGKLMEPATAPTKALDELRRHYASDIERLAQLIDRDLSGWKAGSDAE